MGCCLFPEVESSVIFLWGKKGRRGSTERESWTLTCVFTALSYGPCGSWSLCSNQAGSRSRCPPALCWRWQSSFCATCAFAALRDEVGAGAMLHAVPQLPLSVRSEREALCAVTLGNPGSWGQPRDTVSCCALCWVSVLVELASCPFPFAGRGLLLLLWEPTSACNADPGTELSSPLQ